jgi:hypothetical protein
VPGLGTGSCGAAPGPAALAALTAGAFALALAPLLPVVIATDGAPADPGFPGWPLLAALALLPALAAVLLCARGAAGMATGLVIGYAALAPGRALLDLQLVLDAELASRPELLVPTSLAPLRPTAGAAALLAGHLLTAVAGVLAVLSTRPDIEDPEDPGGVGPVDPLDPVPGGRPGLLVLALGLGAALAVGLLMAPFGSGNAYLLGRSALDSPGWTLAGAVLLAVLAPGAACLLAGSPDPARARGGLLGVAAGSAAVAAPALAAGLLTPQLRPSWGPVTVLLAAAGLVGCGLAVRRAGDAGPHADLVLPAAGRLQRVAAAAALLAGVLALLGSLTPAIAAGDVAVPAVSAARLLVPAAVALLALGAALLLPGDRAAAARPALAVAWVVVPLPAAAVLDTVLTAAEIADVGPGPGAWATLFAVPVAAVAGGCCALAGAVERDDVDVYALAARPADRPLLLAVGLVAALAVPAFALPVATGPGYRAGAIDPASGLTAWGLVTGLVAVVLAAAVAPRCRPVRGAALLVGAGLVVAVRLAELPLVAARLDGMAAAPGTWASLACLVVLVAAVVVTLRPGAGERSPVPRGRALASAGLQSRRRERRSSGGER